MGSCMSKGKNKRKPKNENFKFVVDDDVKLVISQSPSPLLANIALSPSKSPASITSFSSLSSSTSCEFSTTSTLSSISSSSASSSSWSSSVLSAKERSFSNEFLRSCAKENAHVVGLDPIKESSEKLSKSRRIHHQRIESLPSKRVVQVKQSENDQERLASGFTPKKRARNNSPTLVRQKSLRREASSSNYVSSRAMRSPSPSRRFNMESPSRVAINATREGFIVSGKVKNGDYGGSANLKNDLSRRHSFLKSKERSIQKIDAKIAKNRVGKMQDKMDIDSIFIEDINNPHIALDCFIFL